ncbi:MAG: DMT family transporter [Rubrivivax sp.]|nr:DMT family transporter [Rubrivivax sp.]MBK8528567.1 DMT family transporter [Rubrivivax sp.]
MSSTDRLPAGAADNAWVQAMPAVFVLIWSTGFVVARLGMPHAPPFGFLTWRYAMSLLLFVLWAGLARAAWPQGRSQWLHLAVTGVLMHGGYLGGVWSAVKAGLGAGTVALIVGLQPLITAVWMSAQGPAHSVNARQWLGLAMGLAGLLLVVLDKLGAGQATAANLAMALAALASITAGTLYQKRWLAPCDVRSAVVVQLLAALVVSAPLALLETEAMDWHRDLVLAMGWSVFALTLGGSSLLYLLIQRGAATRVSSLMYLVPPCTAIMAWLMFDEPITVRVVAGVVITAAGVSLVLRDGPTRSR